MPPANPYGAIAGGASIVGAAGQYSIRAGNEVRVGRDPAQCAVLLQEPRISGWHATLKFEGGQLWVRDESSNNGTYVDGARIAPATWTPLTPASQLRFGPVDFGVRLDPSGGSAVAPPGALRA
jgi:predicted component of type VI protein secretion system